MRTALPRAAALPLLVLLAACPGSSSPCRTPGQTRCEVVESATCAERLDCFGFGATAAGGRLYVGGAAYTGALAPHQRASVLLSAATAPAPGETWVWTPGDDAGFESASVQIYGSGDFPLPITHAAGEAGGHPEQGGAYPAQGEIRLHVDAVSDAGALTGWLEADCPARDGSSETVTLRIAFGPGLAP